MANSKFPDQDCMLPFFEPDHLILRERTRRWVDEKGLSFSRHHGNLEERAIALVRELGAGGFLKYTVSEEFGGIRATVQARDLCILREELARGDALSDTMFAMQALGSYPISLAGNGQQESRLLPAIARGESSSRGTPRHRRSGDTRGSSPSSGNPRAA
jgi:acyl-CoA dehydrogenase